MPRKLPAWKLRALEREMTTTAGWNALQDWLMLEADFQSHCVLVASQLGWDLAYHTHDSRRSNVGFPDLVLARTRDKRVLYLELKAMGKEPESEQLQWAEVLTACGQEHHFLWPNDRRGKLEEILR